MRRQDPVLIRSGLLAPITSAITLASITFSPSLLNHTQNIWVSSWDFQFIQRSFLELFFFLECPVFPFNMNNSSLYIRGSQHPRYQSSLFNPGCPPESSPIYLIIIIQKGFHYYAFFYSINEMWTVKFLSEEPPPS